MIGIGADNATHRQPIMVADIFGDHVRLSGAQATNARIPTYKKWPTLVGIPVTNANSATFKFEIPIQGASSFPVRTARLAKVHYFLSKSDMYT